MSENFRSRRQRITILRRVETRNSFGEVIAKFEHFCTTWAEINGDAITIRYQRDLLPGWRLVIDEEVREIVGVVDIKKPTRLVRLTVKEFTDTGHRRFYPVGFDGEQRPLRASIEPASNASE